MGQRMTGQKADSRTFWGRHYAWVITALCMLMMCVGMGLNANTFFLYEPYLMRAFDFTNTQNSLINTARALTVIPGMLSVGLLIRRFGIRRTACAGIFIQAATRLLFSEAQDFSHCCIASGLAGFCYAWTGVVPVSILISRWFRKRQGLALGIGMSGSGIASAVFSPLITERIETQGLAEAFRMEAVFTVLAGAAVMLLLRDTPEEMGLLPYGAKEAAGAPGQAESGSTEKEENCREAGGSCRGEETKQTRPDRRPLHPLRSRGDEALLMLILLMVSGPGGPGFSHLSVHYAHSGFSPEQIAALMSVLGISLIAGKIAGGEMADYFGGFFSNYLIGGAYLLSMLFCCLAAGGSMRLAVISQILLGIGLPITNISPPIWAKDLFPPERFDRLVQHSQLFFALGNFCFQPLPGVIADLTGSYVPVYVIFIAETVLLLLLIQSLYRKAERA